MKEKERSTGKPAVECNAVKKLADMTTKDAEDEHRAAVKRRKGSEDSGNC